MLLFGIEVKLDEFLVVFLKCLAHVEPHDPPV